MHRLLGILLSNGYADVPIESIPPALAPAGIPAQATRTLEEARTQLKSDLEEKAPIRHALDLISWQLGCDLELVSKLQKLYSSKHTNSTVGPSSFVVPDLNASWLLDKLVSISEPSGEILRENPLSNLPSSHRAAYPRRDPDQTRAKMTAAHTAPNKPNKEIKSFEPKAGPAPEPAPKVNLESENVSRSRLGSPPYAALQEDSQSPTLKMDPSSTVTYATVASSVMANAASTQKVRSIKKPLQWQIELLQRARTKSIMRKVGDITKPLKRQISLLQRDSARVIKSSESQSGIKYLLYNTMRLLRPTGPFTVPRARKDF